MDEHYGWISSIGRWCLMFTSITIKTNNTLTTTWLYFCYGTINLMDWSIVVCFANVVWNFSWYG